MLKFLPFAGLFFLYCSNFDPKTNYIIRSVDQDVFQQGTRQTEILVNQTGNVTTRHITTSDSRGIRASNARIVSEGRTKIWYINDQLDRIKTKDDQTNCEYVRSFSSKKIYEKKMCDGHNVRIISISSDHIYENNCSMSKGILTCQSTYNGEDKDTTYEYEINQHKIRSFMLNHSNGIDTYRMSSRKEIPNGEQIDSYVIDLPTGSALPEPHHANWQFEDTMIQTGYIASIQEYSSIIISDKGRSFKQTIDIY